MIIPKHLSNNIISEFSVENRITKQTYNKMKNSRADKEIKWFSMMPTD